MCTSIDEDDHLTAYHQREAFHLRRAEARRALRRTFDLTEEQLRTIEFEGILAGWPLESR